MSKIAIWIIVAVVVVGGGWYLMSGTPSDTPNEASVENNNSLRKLLSSGENIRCEGEFMREGATVEGITYVTADGRMRGDFTMSSPEIGTLTSHVIRSGGWMHNWGETPMGTMGTKIQIDAEAPEKESEAADLDQEVDYDCSPWRVDESLLTPPSDITFQDLSAGMMQQ